MSHPETGAAAAVDLAVKPPTVALPRRKRTSWRRLVNPGLPLLALGIFILTAILAPLLTPWDPIKHDLAHSLRPPAWMEKGSDDHLLGTDGFGRDVLARLIYGTRVTFLVVGFSLIIAIVIGTVVGLVAGYRGGWVDSVLMRLTDSLLTLPRILVAIVVAIAVGASFRTLVLVLGLLIWMNIARLIRGEALALKQQDFVRYSKAIGVPGWIVALRHIGPNVLPILLVATTLEIGHVILAEAALSFLGAGLPPPQPSWGVMIADGWGLIASAWWIAFFPGVAIVITVLACNALGDWLRDYLDPRTR